MLAALVALGMAALVEHRLEMRDLARLTTDDTFSLVDGKQVRYRLVGANEPGPPIILVSGLMGSLEQWHNVQDPLAEGAPVLAYDRGGMGFSELSDAHDADAQAEELVGLLHSVQLSPPFVLVSYSASALMVRLFAARHGDQVKGLVLLDPILPEATHAPPRQFVALALKSLVGVMRIKMLKTKKAAGRTEEKEHAILSSFHHWYATAADGLRLRNWTPRLMGAPSFKPIPVGVLCTFDSQNERNRSAIANSRALAAESPRGILATNHLDHGTLLTDPVGSAVVVSLVRTIENEARLLETQTPLSP
jgi:pimeloyl-ACP methyl ester carboxylesterase